MRRDSGVTAAPDKRGKDAGSTLDASKLLIYLICLGVLFGLFLTVRGPGSSLVFWVCAGIATLGIVAGALAPVALGVMGGRLPQISIGLAIVLALESIFGDASSGTTRDAFIWPSALVLLFASRVLIELADLRLILAWRAPLQAHPSVTVHSLGAALALGGFLTIVFNQLLAMLVMQPSVQLVMGSQSISTGSIIVDALHGKTVVHQAVIYLFFVVVAFIADAWRLHWCDKRALGAFAQNIRETANLHAPGTSLPMVISHVLQVAKANYPGSWTLLACSNIIDNGGKVDDVMQPAFRATTDFHHASRRFMKGLVPLLPLLGFVGTVIGLSITLSQLPHDTSQAGQAALDISASLGGLAIKFQTTLLGLVGGMIASTAINLLEKAETELLGECALIISAVSQTSLEAERVE